jgi:hypothetical protein
MEVERPNIYLWTDALSNELEKLSDEDIAIRLRIKPQDARPYPVALIEFPNSDIKASIVLKRNFSGQPLLEIVIYNSSTGAQLIPNLNNVYWEDGPTGPDALHVGFVEDGMIVSVLQRLANHTTMAAWIETQRHNTAAMEAQERGYRD